MMISTFDELIAAAHAQPNDQHLLLVYTAAELPEDSTPEQRAQFEAGIGGALVPTICVDKAAPELTTFAALCEEAKSYVNKWDVLFAAALDVPALQQLSDEQIHGAMEQMLAEVKAGQISKFIAFDPHGHAIQLH